MYILKQLPEDFIVKEISNVKVSEDKSSGKYIYFQLKKKNRNTLDVVKEIAKQLGLKEKQVGFAGSKDKNAVTEQVCSVLRISKEKLLKLKLDNIKIKFLGYGNKPISLGDLTGNNFEIIVRHLDRFAIDKTKYFPNYFDEQRFSLHNVDIGRHLLKKEFKEAVKLIDDTRCEEHLRKHQNDFVGAMKKLPLRLLRMYLNAYQSYLWNETVAEYLRRNGEVLKEVAYSLGKLVFIKDTETFLGLEVPLIGFASEDLVNNSTKYLTKNEQRKDKEIKDKEIDSKKIEYKELENQKVKNKEIKEIITSLMKKEDLDYTDFIFKEIPELSLEGELRTIFVEIKNLKVGQAEGDELNSGKKKVKLSFSLGKGSYATMVVKKIVNIL